MDILIAFVIAFSWPFAYAGIICAAIMIRRKYEEWKSKKN